MPRSRRRPFGFFPFVACLALPLIAFADETFCTGNVYECTGPKLGLTNAFPAASPCVQVPTLPPDPLGTYASIDRGGGQGLVGAKMQDAVPLSDEAYRCLHPIGSASPNGGVICGYESPTPSGVPNIVHWGSGVYAGASQQYDWNFKVNDQDGLCTVNQSLGFSVSEGNSLRCPVTYSHAYTSDGKADLCYRPRILKDCCVGDPIRMGNSETVITEEDYVGSGPFPLRIARKYGHESGDNSLGEPLDSLPIFGQGWRTEYHRHVWVFVAPLATLVTLRREDGHSLTFSLDPATNAVTAMPTEKGKLERLTDEGGALSGWRYTSESEEVEAYDGSGKLLSITNAQGLVQAIAYDSQDRIDTVTDEFGRQLVFHYGDSGLIDTISVPGGLFYSYAYAPNQALEAVTYPDGATRHYLYEIPTMPWAVTGIVDERGVRVVSYSYNTSTGFATSSEHAGGVDRHIVTPSSATDPLGAVHNYAFSANSTAGGYLLEVLTDPRIGGGYTQKSYAHDANGNVTRYVDNINHVTTYTNDLARNLETQRVEGSGTTAARTIGTQWHPGRRLRKAVAEPLRITSYSYNGEPGISCAPAGASTALLCTKTVQATTDATGGAAFTATADGAARTWAYTYDTNGLLLSVDGPRTDVNDVTMFTYDAIGNLASMTNALGQTTQYTDYEPSGRLLRSVDPAGVETLLDYHVRGWLAHRKVGTAASGYEVTSYDHDATGKLSRVTLPDGSYVAYEYDDAHRLVGLHDGFGNRIHYTLDNAGNRTAEQAFDVQGQLVRSHSRIYDILGRATQDIGGTDPATQVTVNAYDADANLLSVTDPLSRVTSQAYDGRNRLKQVNDPLNGSAAPTKYEYNGRDQVTKVTDPRNLVTTYAFNGHDEKLSETSASTGTTTFTYDEASNVTSKLDARGVVATYTYDALNRVTQIAYPDETVTYTHDCAGNAGRLCSIADATGTTTYGYDAHGHVSSKIQAVGTLAQTVAYEYNAAGQLARITLPSGRVIDYGYENNRPVSVAVDGQVVLDGAFYEPFGPNGGWRWGNSTGTTPNFHTRVFDEDFRATSVASDLPVAASASPAFDRQFSWDAASRIQSIADIADTTLNATYGYDALDRLTSASQAAGSWGYAFDGDGNRTSSTANGAQTTYAYFAGSNRLQSLAGARVKAYSYDAAGNMTSDGYTTWTYGGDNRPTQVVSGALAVQFDINALGQRVRKTVGTDATRFMYDEAGHLVGEYADDGSAIEETVWLADLPVAVIRPQPAAPLEAVVDDDSPAFATSGPWSSSTAVAGYLGSGYRVHAPGANTVGAILVDNTDGGFTTTGTWTASTAVAGYLGTNYAVHAANGAPPGASVVDNADPGASVVGTWATSTSVSGYLGGNYQVHAAGTGANTFTWNVPVATAGTYEVYARWTAYPNRATDAAFTVATAAGPQTVAMNQQWGAGQWNLVGTWVFDAGNAAVTLSDQGNGYVIADAVMLVPPGAAPNTATWTATLPTAGPWRVYARWAQHPNRATNATYVVQADGGPVPSVVDQQAGGGSWELLGEYTFSGLVGRVDLSDQADGYVVADAIKFEPRGAPLEAATWSPGNITPAAYDVYAQWTASANRSPTATYAITHTAGTTEVIVNQQSGGGAWNLLGTFTFAPGQGVSLQASDAGYVVADGVRFVPAALQPTTGGIYYVHPDHLGTPRMITRASDNAIVWRWDNAEPFGDSQPNEDPSGVGRFAYNLRFPGQYFDSETGTMYNYFRDYDPSIGRYVESDPIGLRAGLNTYAYVRGNPLSLMDPDGLQVPPWIGGAGAAEGIGGLGVGGVGSGSNSGNAAKGNAALAQAFSDAANDAARGVCVTKCYTRYHYATLLCDMQHDVGPRSPDNKIHDYLVCIRAAAAILKACLSSCDECYPRYHD